jgi:Trp operon repressor
VYESSLLKIQYESFEDWRLHRDLLRCNPCVYGKERRDCVLVNTQSGVAIARLLMLLECSISASSHPLQLAVIVYFDLVRRALSPLERALGFRRLRQRPRQSAEIISVSSITRGALMVPTLGSQTGDFLANDLVDSDMYLRFLEYSKHNVLS